MALSFKKFDRKRCLKSDVRLFPFSSCLPTVKTVFEL